MRHNFFYPFFKGKMNIIKKKISSELLQAMRPRLKAICAHIHIKFTCLQYVPYLTSVNVIANLSKTYIFVSTRQREIQCMMKRFANTRKIVFYLACQHNHNMLVQVRIFTAPNINKPQKNIKTTRTIQQFKGEK